MISPPHRHATPIDGCNRYSKPAAPQSKAKSRRPVKRCATSANAGGNASSREALEGRERLKVLPDE